MGGQPVARARRRVPWLSTVGPALTLADLVAVVVAGRVVGASTVAVAGATVAAVLVARVADLHRPRLVLSVLADLPGLLVAAAGATAVLAGAGDVPVGVGLLALGCLVLSHSVAYAATHLLRRTGRLRRRVLVVGTGATARRLAVTLLARPELGLWPVGFVGSGARVVTDQARGLPLPLLGAVAALPRAMTETRVDAVVVALAGPPGDAETAAVEGLLAARADVFAVPTWFPAVPAHARHPRELIGGVPLVHLHRRGTWWPVRVVKRVVEVLVALVSLTVLLPLAAVLTVLVLLETGGVLVRRTRVDEAGLPVSERRFRTRRARSVARPGTTFSIAISGRTGPVGRLLRRTRLDALPEVLLVLLRRARHAGGVADRGAVGSAPAAGADQAQVDAGQLTR